MWDKRKTETPAPPPPVEPAMRNTAAPPPPIPERKTGATIGKAVKIIGDVVSGEDLFIDGEVDGALQVKDAKLTIGPNGKAKSNIIAREVVIQGEVNGNIEATQKITIRKEGSLVGNIKTTGIIIEDDAYFKGSIDIVRNHAEAAARG